MSQNDKTILWSGVLIIQKRRALTLKETDKAFYIMPGGKLEAG
jgi:8-oxo-dGTP pyrophosphatase MutT (NUDIX family)